VHSPLRQAIAVIVRLGCPLQQIGYTYLALARNPGGYRPGLQIYTLAKGRTVTLGHAVSSAFSCGVSIRDACGLPALMCLYSQLNCYTVFGEKGTAILPACMASYCCSCHAAPAAPLEDSAVGGCC
jgi:hypothetical protein